MYAGLCSISGIPNPTAVCLLLRSKFLPHMPHQRPTNQTNKPARPTNQLYNDPCILYPNFCGSFVIISSFMTVTCANEEFLHMVHLRSQVSPLMCSCIPDGQAHLIPDLFGKQMWLHCPLFFRHLFNLVFTETAKDKMVISKTCTCFLHALGYKVDIKNSFITLKDDSFYDTSNIWIKELQSNIRNCRIMGNCLLKNKS